MEKAKNPRAAAITSRILKQTKKGKVASFIGNEVLPELGALSQTMNIDNQQRTIKELNKLRLFSIAKYLNMLSPEKYQELIKHVRG